MNYPQLDVYWTIKRKHNLFPVKSNYWCLADEFLTDPKVSCVSYHGSHYCRELMVNGLAQIYREYGLLMRIFENKFKVCIESFGLSDDALALLKRILLASPAHSFMIPSKQNVLEWNMGEYISLPALSFITFFMTRSRTLNGSFPKLGEVPIKTLCEYIYTEAGNLFSNDPNRGWNAFYTGMAIWKLCGKGLKERVQVGNPSFNNAPYTYMDGIAEYTYTTSHPADAFKYARYLGLDESDMRDMINPMLAQRLAGITWSEYYSIMSKKERSQG